jgi:hypothetical protein
MMTSPKSLVDGVVAGRAHFQIDYCLFFVELRSQHWFTRIEKIQTRYRRSLTPKSIPAAARDVLESTAPAK